jgi:hypothetical protein
MERLDSLSAEKQRLEASGERKDRAQEIHDTMSAVQRELEAAKKDPWVERLRQRIAEKEKETAALEEAIAKKNGETEKTVEELSKTVHKNVELCTFSRESLKRELKKAKLKRELDLLSAKNEKQRKKALADYEEKELGIYADLLSVMYTNEEGIVESAAGALSRNFENRKYDLETQMKKDRERVADEFAFQERYLTNRVSELQKQAKAEGGGQAARELAAVQKELAGEQDAHKAALEELEKRSHRALVEEGSAYAKGVEELAWRQKVTRLVYLQTDTPYLNTVVHASITNVGSKVKFVDEAYPLPAAVHVGAGYALLNSSRHTVRFGAQLDVPLYDEAALGVGAEYGFHRQVFVRAGYSFLTPYRSYSAGAGFRLPIAFTEISVDYGLQPIPEYGLVHNFGVSALF